MKAGVLAGGLGTRLAQETEPMAEIGGHPIMWHITMRLLEKLWREGSPPWRTWG